MMTSPIDLALDKILEFEHEHIESSIHTFISTGFRGTLYAFVERETTGKRVRFLVTVSKEKPSVDTMRIVAPLVWQIDVTDEEAIRAFLAAYWAKRGR